MRNDGIIHESMSRINNYNNYSGPLAVLEWPLFRARAARSSEAVTSFLASSLAGQEEGVWFSAKRTKNSLELDSRLSLE